VQDATKFPAPRLAVQSISRRAAEKTEGVENRTLDLVMKILQVVQNERLTRARCTPSIRGELMQAREMLTDWGVREDEREGSAAQDKEGDRLPSRAVV
jgi:hypothetical protein